MSVSSVHVSRRYHLGGEIGRGSLGIVYRAYDRLTGQTVALKRLPIEPMRVLPPSQSGDLRLALAREFRVLASLRHPHIISVLDYGFDAEQAPYYTMDLLENAQTIVAYGQSLGLERKVDLIIELLQALAYLHRRGILHRDLKPANVLVINDQVKVVDFELAVVREQIERGGETLAGTLEYMSPEVLQNEAPSEASDLYAVGVIAYELLAGRYPYDSSSLNRLLTSVLYSLPDWSLIPATERLGAILATLLAKSPGERYRDAIEVIQALSAALDRSAPLETTAIRESYLQAASFVGRKAEYRQLASALGRVLTGGTGSAWLIGGESGVGKSRLIDELRIEAIASGALVLRGQAASDGVPYELLRDPLRRLLLETEADYADLSILKQIVPDVERLTEQEIPEPDPLDGIENQRRLLAVITRAFRSLAQPTVLILEDIQWAEDTHEALAALVELADRVPLLIIGSFRDDETPDLVERFAAMRPIALGRLPQGEIAELSAAMLGETGRLPGVVELLQRETEGNVFFLVEVVRALAEEAGGLERVGAVALPPRVTTGGVAAIVHRRLNRVPSWGQPLLKLAAVAGRTLDVALLERVVWDGNGVLPGGTDVTQWLTVCSNASVLDAQDGYWRFQHDKLREALVQGLGNRERAQAHRAIALATEAVYPNDPSRAISLTEHWRRAGDTAREARYAQTAVEQLLLVSNLREAVALAQRALALVTEASAKARLLARLGEAEHSLGNLEDARTALEEGLKLARAADDKATEIRTLSNLGNVYARQGNYDVARRQFRQSLALAEETNNRRAIATNLEHLGDMAARQGAFAEARELYTQGLAINREIGNKRGIAGCLSGLAWAASGQSDLPTAIHYYTQSLALARELGDRRAVASDLGNLGAVSTTQGDYVAANRYYRESLAINRDIGHKAGAAWGLWALGRVAYLQGEYTGALDLVQESLSIFQAMGDKVFIAANLRLLGQIAAASGDYPKARRLFEQSLTLAQDSGQRLGIAANYLFLGRLEAACGDRKAARRYFEQSLTLAREMDFKDYIADNLTELGHLAATEGEIATARECFERSLALAGDAGYREGLHATWMRLGRHAALSQRLEEALDAYQESLSIAQASNMKANIAASLIQLARIHHRLGHRERALACLQQGLRLARDVRVAPSLLDALLCEAVFRFDAGDAAGSARLAGLVQRHPATTAETREDLDRLLAALERRLPASVLNDLLDAGASEGLERVTADVLALGRTSAAGPRPAP